MTLGGEDDRPISLPQNRYPQLNLVGSYWSDELIFTVYFSFLFLLFLLGGPCHLKKHTKVNDDGAPLQLLSVAINNHKLNIYTLTMSI